jgi:hypothetical protein
MNDKREVTVLVQECDGRVSLHGQVETCSYALLNVRNGLNLGICQTLCICIYKYVCVLIHVCVFLDILHLIGMPP